MEPPFPREQLIRLLPDADAVLACTALDREMIAAAKKLQLIVCYGAGYDAIDVAAATSHGIPVVNTPECVTRPTAEMAIALITSLARRLPELNALMHTRPPRELFGMGRRMGTSLDGSVLGVVGHGTHRRQGSGFCPFDGHCACCIPPVPPSRSETRWAIRAYRWRT